MASEGFFERVYEVVEQIPEGMVATYGQVALLAGRPRSARYVGYALHSNPRPFPKYTVESHRGEECESNSTGQAFSSPIACSVAETNIVHRGLLSDGKVRHHTFSIS